MSTRGKLLRRGRGFTLVELLVVIGVIALLIAILMPALSLAKRRSATLKCLSNLRSVGLAFQLYEGEHKGRWPVAVHNAGFQGMPAGIERRWSDLLAKYITYKQGKNEITGERQIRDVRLNSVLWGCPEWTKSSERIAVGGSAYADDVRTGYGMQYYPTFFEDGNAKNLAYISSNTTGSYVSSKIWGRKSSQRGLVADSITHIIGTPGTFSKSSTVWQPFASNPATGFMVDSTRHAKPGTTKIQSTREKGLNMLFCDGHAEAVSVVDAWNAIHNPGVDNSKP